MERKKLLSLIKGTILITGFVLSALSIVSAFVVHAQREDYFDKKDIFFEEFSVKMEDGIEINGFLFVNKDLKKESDNSVPTILLIHGINGRKESNFDKVFQLVKRGYAVFSVEQRGHGDSGGLSGFIGKEPHDMMEVIDFIEKKYDFADVKHLGLLAFSFGGGVAVVLQALDDRVYASVIYHPLSSLDKLSEQIPFQRLIGFTSAIEDVKEIEDGYDVCTPENTENLLLIQGDQDDLIKPEYTEELYDQVNGSNRDDIDLEIRPGLDHGGNEADETSFKHALVWFEHFYHKPSINITDREKEIEKIDLYAYNYPSNSIPELLILIGTVVLFVGMSSILVPKRIWRKFEDSSTTPIGGIDSNKIDEGIAYKKMVIYRTILYVLPAVIGALLFGLLDPAYIYGYCLAIPLATFVILLFVPSSDFSDWKKEWRSWYKNDREVFFYGLCTISIPVFIYVLVFNLNAYVMKSSPVPFFTSTTLVYLMMGFGLLFADWAYIRGFKLKHTLLLLGTRPLTLLIFFLFVPIPPFLYFDTTGFFYLTIFLCIGGVIWIILFLLEIPRLVFKNRIIVFMVVFLPILVFLSYRFFRIV